ncbi:hypothetical protein ZWY2020_020034 [Hordeum vulgare]|nr:hypothetical protein ZWY2020_020034 [Hordeum vulgare]
MAAASGISNSATTIHDSGKLGSDSSKTTRGGGPGYEAGDGAATAASSARWGTRPVGGGEQRSEAARSAARAGGDGSRGGSARRRPWGCRARRRRGSVLARDPGGGAARLGRRRGGLGHSEEERGEAAGGAHGGARPRRGDEGGERRRSGLVAATGGEAQKEHGGEIETGAAFTGVVLRLRTPDSGRDEWLYCHSGVLAAGSGYLACARTAPRRHPHLACTRAAAACTDYLESAPWDEADEEILAAAPRLGAHRVLARLRPADPGPATAIFLACLGAHRARLRPRAPRRPPCTPPPSRPSAPTAPASSLKSAAQEQREYMLTEDDDASLLTFDAGGSNASSLTPLKVATLATKMA